ncbi:MAG: flagellar biosynthetic protein FliO [Alphaproteobacteria bacterium]|nr:flagellar biosynthetic protein FliO [Alphaproteobacteria bacterium]
MGQEFLSVFSVLFIMLGLFGLIAWAVKRFGLLPGLPKTTGSRKLKMLESQSLDGRNRLTVVEWRGHQYLVGSGPSGVTLIDKSEIIEYQDEAEAH